MLIEIFFGGGIIIYVVSIWVERLLKKNEKKKIKEAMQELYLEETLKNEFVLDHIEKSCEYKMLNPRTFFASNGLFLNVIDYVLENLIELNIDKNQFKKLMEIKIALQSVLYWQDEYVNGTKGDLKLIYDKDIINYYVPIIKGAVEVAKKTLEENKNVFLAAN